MAERGRYRTKQQELILDCLREQKDVFLTVDQLMVYLGQKEIQVGQTTVYRTLDRLTGDGVVIRIPSVNGSKAQYRYLGEDETSEPGKMICLRCGRIVPLECSHLKEFSRHIRQEHGFLLEPEHLILYGYCSQCGGGLATGHMTDSHTSISPAGMQVHSCHHSCSCNSSEGDHHNNEK